MPTLFSVADALDADLDEPHDSRPEPPFSAPPLLHRIMESRAITELGAFVAASPFLRMVGRGDRHPVLVLPGFMADDRSTIPLRWVLQNQGYAVQGWGLGSNVPTAKLLTGLRSRLLEIHERIGRPVSLVGWSLGGILARELAREHPEQVRQVVTLGSPFRMRGEDHSSIEGLVEMLHLPLVKGYANISPEHDRAPIRVPTTAIYTRTDGVIRWQACVDGPATPNAPRRENVEVRGSHSGLGHNPAVVYAIADRLARSTDDWRPFKAPLGLRCWYPTPQDWHSHHEAAAA